MSAFYYFSRNHTNELDCVRSHVVSGWPGSVGAYDSFLKERWIPPAIAAHWRAKAPPLEGLNGALAEVGEAAQYVQGLAEEVQGAEALGIPESVDVEELVASLKPAKLAKKLNQ